MAITRPVVSGGIKVARLTGKDTPSLLNQRVCRFRSRGTIDVDYAYQYMFSQTYINKVIEGATGSHQPNISTGKIAQISLPVPSIITQKSDSHSQVDCHF